ncbi:MAG: asparagine synthase B [Rhodothermales bacterium]
MCSILGILQLRTDPADVRSQALELSKLQRHRGPDWSGIFANDRAVLAHERLSIVDVAHGAQPLVSPDGRYVLAVNGEIYNHVALRREFPDYAFRTQSDCEVIIPLLAAEGPMGVARLNGIFAFILYDTQQDTAVIARDPLGVIPLYTGFDADGQFLVASELKALTPVCRQVDLFMPGHVLVSPTESTPTRYWNPEWREWEHVRHADTDPALAARRLRRALEDAVHRQLMGDVPYGVLLSGGLDSSITAALAAQFAANRVDDNDASPAWWPRLHSFAIGLEGSPDLAAAERVAEHIGTVHHGLIFTIQEGLDALRDVVYHLETYDVTTIRASTPMFLMARRIRAMGIKMVLSGEGADEIFGGYLYFHKAPDAREFHEETVRKLDRLHLFDCNRANKSMAAWGIEARVPFLDLEFLDVAMSLNPELKLIRDGRIEKQILRDACRDLLPDAIYRRQKEQFSDGVGYGWIDALRDHAAAEVSDADLERAAFRFPINTPDTKEGFLYRTIFEEHFPLESAARTVPGGKSVACSTPEALAWDASFSRMADPSGRAVSGVHDQAYGAGSST